MQKHVGYDTIVQVLLSLLKDKRILDHILGLILSTSQEDFSLSNVFATLRSSGDPNLKPDFASYKTMLGTIKHVDFLNLLVVSLPFIPQSDTFPERAILTLLETLVSSNHRNKVLMSSTSLFKTLFDRLINSDSSDTLVRSLLQKTLRKLLEIGVEITDVRALFREAVKEDKSLDTDILEIIRSGMKAKWPMHYSMERKAGISLLEQNARGLPPTGLTFMVSQSLRRDVSIV